MKFFRRILFGILILFAIVIAIGLFFPKKVSVESSINILAPNYIVFDKISDLESWKYWAQWLNNPENISYEYDNFNNAISIVDKANNYKYSIQNANCCDSLSFLFNFDKKGSSFSKFYLNNNDTSCLLKWKIESTLNNNPVARWFGFYSEKMVIPEMDSTLKQLKNIIENDNKKYYSQINQSVLYHNHTLMINDSVSPSVFFFKIQEWYDILSKKLYYRKAKINGNPFVEFNSIDSLKINYNIYFPISDSILRYPFKYTKFDSTNTINTEHRDKYNLTPDAYYALYKFLKVNKMQYSKNSIEEFQLRDFEQNTLPSDTTLIYIPIQKP